MTTIAATTSTTSISIAQLIADGSSEPQTSSAANTSSDSAPAADSAGSYGAAAFVTLSEQAKQAAATKVVSDQVAADQLQAYVEAHRASAGSADSPQSLFSEAASSTTSGQQQTTTTGDKVQVIVAQIQTLADANEPQPFQSFTPSKSLSNNVAVDGYTLSLDTNAGTQFYGIDLSGNGVSAYSKHFGPQDGGGGVTAVPPGVEVTIGTPGNNEAIDSITITRNVASAGSATIATPSGSASASAVNAQSSSITFLVNYATGAISVQQSALAVSAQSVSTSPGSTLSTLA